MTEKKTSTRKKKPAGTSKPKATPIGAPAIPARFYKPAEETPLLAAFAVKKPMSFAAEAPMAIGAGIATGGQTMLANLMHKLGYATVEEALGVLQVVKGLVARKFGLPSAVIEAFIAALTKLAKPIPDEVLNAITSQHFTFGLSLEDAHRSLDAPDSLVSLAMLQATPTATASGGGIGFTAPSFAPEAPMPIGADAMPAEVNLIDQLANPVRNQGDRQTCVPHSTLVAYEHFIKMTTGKVVDLSEQFVYFQCVTHDGLNHNPDSGTTMTAGANCYDQVGVCPEADWPYNSTVVPGNAGQGPPPGQATFDAAQFKVLHPVIRVTPTAVDDYKLILNSGRCAAIAIPVFPSTVNSAANMAVGKFVLPFSGEKPLGGHAVCIVGFKDDSSIPALGGGRFIIRNSWGTAFGAQSAYGPGCGTIPYAYIASMGRELGIAFQ